MLVDRDRVAPQLLESMCIARPRAVRMYGFTVPRAQAKDWAVRVQPRVVLLWVRALGVVQAGRKLAVPDEPVWRHCNTQASLAFMQDGVWGPLRWALMKSSQSQESEADVELLGCVKVVCSSSGDFEVRFPLPRDEVDFGMGSVA